MSQSLGIIRATKSPLVESYPRILQPSPPCCWTKQRLLTAAPALTLKPCPHLHHTVHLCCRSHQPLVSPTFPLTITQKYHTIRWLEVSLFPYCSCDKTWILKPSDFVTCRSVHQHSVKSVRRRGLHPAITWVGYAQSSSFGTRTNEVSSLCCAQESRSWLFFVIHSVVVVAEILLFLSGFVDQDLGDGSSRSTAEVKWRFSVEHSSRSSEGGVFACYAPSANFDNCDCIFPGRFFCSYRNCVEIIGKFCFRV